MFVMVVGVNYRTAPIDIRERFTFSEANLEIAMKKLKQTKSVLEAVVVGTCNRTEIYAVVDQLHTGEHFIKKFLAEWFSVDKEKIVPYLYVKQDIDATEHLFRVISGLDSMVLGETQILGQMREAFFFAQGCEVTGTVLNTLFKQAITFGKKVHTDTAIGKNAVSVSYAAVELVKKVFDRLADKKVLIIGAGEMGELTAIHLHAQGVKTIMVANRSYAKAEALARTFHGKAFMMEQLPQALQEADIVISSTGASGIIMDKEQMSQVIQERKGKLLCMVDIAVPRDLDPAIHELSEVYLYDIDDLQGIVDANLMERQRIAEEVSLWIDDEVYKFYQWVNTLGVIPLISALREKSFRIQQETMQSIENKLPDLNERERKILRKHTKSIVNQMLKDPIMRIKEMAAEPEAEEMMETFKKIFAIEDEELEPSPVYEGMRKRKTMLTTNKENKWSSVIERRG